MIILLYVVKTLFLGPFTQQTPKATVSLPVSLSVCLSIYMYVCLSVRMVQFGSYGADFTEILYRDSLLKPVGWSQISLKPDKANIHFAQIRASFYDISLLTT